MKLRKWFTTWIPAFAGMTTVSILVTAEPTRPVNTNPTSTSSPTTENHRRYKMGDVDKKENSWWRRTQIFIETSISVGLFFWLPGANVQYKSDNVSVNVGSNSSKK